MFHIPSCADFFKLFHIAVQKFTRKSNDFTYLKLYASSYFRNIAFSFDADLDHLEIPEDIRKEIDQLSDGTAAKLSCYEGILKICTSNVQNGIKQVERSLGGLQNCPDQPLLKCLCLQVLTLYYNNQNELEKSCTFREMAAKVCIEIGNSNLFLIGECDLLLMSNSSKVGVDEPLILFGYLLARWSQTFLEEASVRHVYKFVSNLQKQIEVKAFSSDYAHQICYGDYLLAFFSVAIGQETLLSEKIEFLSKIIEHCNSFSDKTVRNMFQRKSLGRLLICYSTKGGVMLSRKGWNLEACRKALDLSLQINGENTTRSTVKCYISISCAEYAEENYPSALDNIKKALDIMLPLCYEPDDFSLLGEIYFCKGMTYFQLGDIDLAIPSLQESLNMLRRGHLINEENEILGKVSDRSAEVYIFYPRLCITTRLTCYNVQGRTYQF